MDSGGARGVEDNEIIAICDCAPMEPMVALISQSADFVLRNLLLTQISSTADIAILIISNPQWEISTNVVLVISN